MEDRRKCPVCGYYTLAENDNICPICNWYGDPKSAEDELREAIISERKKWNKKLDDDPDLFSEFSLSIRGPLPDELPWVYEHEAEKIGSEETDAMVDHMRVLSYMSDQVHKHELQFYTAARSVFAKCLPENMDWYYATDGELEGMIHTFELLADHGEYVIESNIKLAQCYMYGYGVKKDLKKTAEYLREAAEYAEIKSQEGEDNGEDRLLHE